MIIAYLRVGTSNKEHLEIQKDEIKRFASDHQMNVDKWVTDVTIGFGKGKEDERNIDMVVDRMQKGDTLIFLDISRLVRAALERSPIGGGETVEEIEELDRETRRRTREMLIG